MDVSGVCEFCRVALRFGTDFQLISYILSEHTWLVLTSREQKELWVNWRLDY